MLVAPPRAIPEVGQLVAVRDRHWVVADVVRSALPSDPLATGESEPQHLISLSSVEDDGLGEELRVIWEVEVGARILRSATLPRPEAGAFDEPARLDAFLDAVRWGAVTSADSRTLQSPFRSGITIEDYQLEPVVQAMRMPRANLLIADDVGLGKTIEAGLVIQELILRHRARTVLVVCPATLCLKWQQEMLEKFGLDFRIVDQAALSELRRTRGITANPWRAHPRLIVSEDWLKRDRPMRLMAEVLPADPNTYPRAFDLLVVDEVHTVAPSGRGRYAVDSDRTMAIRTIAPHFEHRLFLSATPHNGYLESFTGLLELLDPQRFARGVEPTREQLARSMVRRLKSELREELGPRPDGTPRFPERQIIALEVEYSDDEKQVHADLVAYAQSQRAGAQGGGARTAADFVTLLLKKRLFSSPAAFAKTLAVHRRTLRAARAEAIAERALARALDRVDDEYDDDEALEEATEDALATAARLHRATSPEQEKLLERMGAWAGRAAGRPDAKVEKLIEWLSAVVRTEVAWNDERVIVFTEYRDTQRWLVEHLTARGLGGERLEQMYGGMDPVRRELVKARFQAHPSLSPLRILVATDAASEGIDLQRHCYRIVHVEIPFSPIRLEQRNGRVDRHGQPSPVVLIHHFVGTGWQGAAPGSYEADLEFLSRTAQKVERIRDQLGSAAPVLAAQVEEAMLGHRTALDEAAVDRRARERRIQRLERDLREEVQKLRLQLDESIEELNVHPANIERVVRVGLELAHQPALMPTVLTRPAGDAVPSGAVYRVPALGGDWARTVSDLPHPADPTIIRPITFEHAVAAGHDDVILAHLGHRLVQMAMRLLRAEVWSQDTTGQLARVTARAVPDGALDEVAAVAHARLVVAGADGHRLHEEVFTSGGRVRGGRFARMGLGELRAALDAATDRQPPRAVLDRLCADWGRIGDSLFAAVTVRADELFESRRRDLDQRARDDIAMIAGVLDDLRTRILAALADPDLGHGQQLDLFGQDQREQLQRDADALRRRVERIPEEIEAETAQIRRRYAEPRRLVFPAAVTFLVPERLAR